MSTTQSRLDLAAMLGFLHQTRAEGELVLEQNDGTRRFFLRNGDLCYVSSDAVGEQFGNYLIRLGVLDYGALKDLLAEEGARVGDRVVQWGLLTEENRDAHLRELFANILLHAVEHPVLGMAWNPGRLEEVLRQDLQFRLDHRQVVWDVYRQMKTLHRLVDKFQGEAGWKWLAKDGLLEDLADLNLTPQIAFAMSQLGREPMGFDTLASVTGLEEQEAARLIAVLWALGGLELEEGEMDQLPNMPSHRKPLEKPIAQPTPASSPTPPTSASPPMRRLQPPGRVARPTPSTPPRPLVVPEDLNPFIEVLDDEPAPKRGLPPPVTKRPEPPRAESVPPSEGEMSAQVRAQILYRQGASLNTQGRTSEAIRSLEQSIKMDPDSAKSYDAWMLLGTLREGNPAWSTRAVEAYQSASRVRPRKGEPWVRMGQLYHRKGFGTNARGCFRKAVELDPSLEVPDLILAPESSSTPKEGVMEKLRGLFGSEKK